MAKGTRGGKRAAVAASTPPAPPAPPAGNTPTQAQPLTDADAAQIRQQFDSSYDASTVAATKMYISNTNFDGQGHSLSQAMNFALDNGVDFSKDSLQTINAKLGTRFSANDIASMQYTDAYMNRAAHAIGRDVQLQRGAHDDMLKNVFGISNYSRMSEAQLQSALVGQKFATTSYWSTSYDVAKNPFLSSSSGSGVSGGREVVYNIKAGAGTRVVFGARKQSEIVINKGTNFRITGVRYTGKVATPRGGASKKQIIIDIETF